MRIGIFGGSFDPLHTAHVSAALAAKQQLSLDRVLFVVSGNPPDGHRPVATYLQRKQMAELALKAYSWAEVSDLERENGGYRYTADTVSAVKRQYPSAELFLLLGEDKLSSLPHWYRSEDIFSNATVAVFPRQAITGSAKQFADCHGFASAVGEYAVVSIQTEQNGVSSTAVRERIFGALPTERMLDPATERYIYEEGCYFPEDENTLRVKMRATLSTSRFTHVMGTVRQTVRLCAMYAPGDGTLAKKARLAALLHDCAKQLPLDTLCRFSGDSEPAAEQVLHAFAGATLAKTVYGITDDGILRAIYCHCTGEAGMSLLDMVTYLADLTEPGRTYPGVDVYRNALRLGPEGAMLVAVKGILQLLSGKGDSIHPATLRTWEWLNRSQASLTSSFTDSDKNILF